MLRKIIRIFAIAIFILIFYKGITFILNDFRFLDKVVVIDAGHGGKDPGTIGFREK